MRLLYAFPEPLPLPRARGLQVAHAATSLAAAGADISLAYVPAGAQSPFDGADAGAANNVDFVPLSRGWPAPLDRIPPFARWHSVRFFARRLVRLIDARRPDVIYVRHLKLAALLLRHRHLPPLVYEAHEIFADTAKVSRQSRMQVLEAGVVARAAGIVCNSRATADRLMQRYGAARRILVLPNGVAPLSSIPEKPWHECRRHIVYAGSFFGWKGVDDLVAAAAQLSGFRMVLVGGNPHQIEQLRREWPVAGGAELEILPRLPQAEAMARMAGACIAVLPNRPDPDSAFTSPIKLFEYMAAGCAIVAADLPSIREIVGDEDVVWFKAGDAESLRLALTALGNDCERARQLGRRVRRMSGNYTWQARAEKLLMFLGEAQADQASRCAA